jgi:hypothetical protein
MTELTWIGALIREDLLDDLIEAGLGNIVLDKAWRSEKIRWLIQSREDPFGWLMSQPSMPGSSLYTWQQERRKS